MNTALDPLVKQMARVVKRLSKPAEAFEELPKALFLRMLDVMDEFIDPQIKANDLLGAFRGTRDRLAYLIIYCTSQRPKSVVELQRVDVSQEGPPDQVLLRFIGHVEDQTFGPKNHQGGKQLNRVAANDDERLDLSRWVEVYTLLECLVWGAETEPPKWMLYNNTPQDFGKILSPRTLNTSFKKWLSKADPTADYTVYCIKVGAVSAGARAGMTKRQRQAHGGWKSDASECYNRFSTKDQLAISKLV